VESQEQDATAHPISKEVLYATEHMPGCAGAESLRILDSARGHHVLVLQDGSIADLLG